VAETVSDSAGQSRRSDCTPELVAAGRDLHELHAVDGHAVPFLRFRRQRRSAASDWRHFNHSIEVNRVLGYENRVAMSKST